MTTDFHLLGAADERLVSRAKDMAWEARQGVNDQIRGVVAELLDELVDRVYRLHEREEELARERENADYLTHLLDDIQEGVNELIGDLRDPQRDNDVDIYVLCAAVARDLENLL